MKRCFLYILHNFHIFLSFKKSSSKKKTTFSVKYCLQIWHKTGKFAKICLTQGFTIFAQNGMIYSGKNNKFAHLQVEFFMRKLKLKLIKRGQNFYYLLLSFMAVLFLCFIVMSGQFIHSTWKNFDNTRKMYGELAEQAINSVSVIVSDLDSCEEYLQSYTGNLLEHLASMGKEEFTVADLTSFYRLYLIAYNMSNQVPGNAAYLYFKNSDYIMSVTSPEDARETGEFDMLGISEEDWKTLTAASSVPVTFIQQTDQMTFSRLFIAKEVASDVVLVLALPEGQISGQMEQHYLPENSHVLMITPNDQFVMSGTQKTEQISLSWEDLQENTADTVSFENASYYLYSRKIPDTDIKLAVLIPDVLKSQMMHSLLVTLPVFFLIWLICGGCISWFFAVRLYRPVLFLLQNLPFQDYSQSRKSDLARIQDLVHALQNKARSYEEKLNEQKELLANNVFARLLNHSLDWNEHICEVLAEADFPVDAGEYFVFLISASPMTNSQGNDDPLSVLQSLDFQNILKNAWNAEGYPCYVILSDRYFTGILSIPSAENMPDFQKLQNFLPPDCTISFSIAVSGLHSSMQELPLAYSEALQAADHLLLNNCESMICSYSDLDYPVSEGHNQFLAGIQLLSNYIQSANFDAVQKELDNMALLLGKISSSSRIFQRNLLYLTQTVMISAESISSIDPQKLKQLQKEISTDLHASASASCIQLQAFVSHLPDCMLADNHEEEILRQIVQYVRKNYTDSSLSAGAVAEHFHVSISWLSVHFKSGTGMGFLDYVHGCRLAKAKELLRATNTSIKDIALMVGYTNSATFSRAFSRYEGVTPSWYRSSKQNCTSKK